MNFQQHDNRSQAKQSSLTHFFAPPIRKTRPVSPSSSSSLSASSFTSNKKRNSVSISPSADTQDKLKKKRRQFYLDFGQRDFGKSSICPVCGMLTVHGVAEDDKIHQSRCRVHREGVSWKLTKESGVAAVVVRDAQLRDRTKVSIVQITPGKSYRKHKPKLERVMDMVQQDLGLVDFTTAANNKHRRNKITTYLAIRHDRVVGSLTVEPLRQAHRLLQSADNTSAAATGCYRSTTPTRSVVAGIETIWVHEAVRQQGVATLLVNALRDHYVYGMILDRQQIAFSSPSTAGVQFARHYQGDKTVLVYDRTTPSSSDAQRRK